MSIIAFFVFIALVFGVCFLFDKGFTKIFRGKAQHRSGRSVRLNKRFGSFGLILAIVGIAAIFAGIPSDLALGIGGAVVCLVGIGLVIYYLSFGIFYDDTSFIVTKFARRSVTYQYDQIVGQKLYYISGGVLIELHMDDNRTIDLQSKMEGSYPFLDQAYLTWSTNRGIDKENAQFHDPANSLWFPTVEDL